MDLIIYHRDCPDGFCAAFVAKKKYPEAELVGKTYGEPVPYELVTKKDVLVVDFSWRLREENDELASSTRSFRILDHHKTAQVTLKGAPYATFDMERSGAAITWDELFGGPRPWYVNYVQDRDLWQWKLPRSREVSAYTMALPHTVEAWNKLDTLTAEQAANMGAGIVLHIAHYIEKAVAQRSMGFLDGHSVAIVNAQYMNISEVAEVLCTHAEIGAGWFERGDGMIQFSLRSRGELDVSAIAKKLGGGGHKNAAGFQLPLIRGRNVLDGILGRINVGDPLEEALEKTDAFFAVK